MTTTQRRGRVKAHTRTVNGRRQRVKSHRRALQPARAQRNLALAWHSIRRRQWGRAALVAGAAAAEVGGWLAFRGAGVVLVTLGIGATAAGVSVIRATRSEPKSIRESRLLTSGPRHQTSQWKRGARRDPRVRCDVMIACETTGGTCQCVYANSHHDADKPCACEHNYSY